MQIHCVMTNGSRHLWLVFFDDESLVGSVVGSFDEKKFSLKIEKNDEKLFVDTSDNLIKSLKKIKKFAEGL